MKKTILSTIAAILIAGTSTAQSTDAKVSINARATDLRATLANLFDQAKKSYIFQPNMHGIVYASFEDVDFSKALKIVCDNQGLVYDIRDGVYYVRMATTSAPVPTETLIKPTPATQTAVKTPAPKQPRPEKALGQSSVTTKPQISAEITAPKKVALSLEPLKKDPSGTPRVLPMSILNKKVTARIQHGDIRKVFGDFARQAKITIEISDDVPKYKIDAYLMNTSLKYALDKITDAAGLEYRFTENYSIAIGKPKPTKVALNN